MKLLLDTHAFIWWDSDPTQLSAKALAALLDPANEVWMRVASVWEMVIKVQLGKMTLRVALGLWGIVVASSGLARGDAIHDAVLKGDKRAVVKALHDDPASVNAVDEKCGTPLQIAVLNGDTDLATLLLARGAKLDVYTAAGLGKIQQLQEMLKGAPKLANCSDASGCTPLHYAASGKQLEAARVLLEHGADPSARSAGAGDPTTERTPLQFAVLERNLEIAKLLLEHGADPHIKG